MAQFTAAYLKLPRDELKRRAGILADLASPCHLCLVNAALIANRVKLDTAGQDLNR